MDPSPTTHRERWQPGTPPAGTVPEGQRLRLPGRGSTYVTDTPGPAGAPPLLLLHGVGCTGLLSWYSAIPVLAEHFRVVTMDQRGHGDGISDPRFSLRDCADDAAAVIEQLDLPGALVMGHSMGSLVAQRLWRQHPHLVTGLVLCSSTDLFRSSPRNTLFFGTVDVSMAMTRWVPRPQTVARTAVRAARSAHRPPGDTAAQPSLAWMVREWRKTEARAVTQAVAACGRHHSAPWLHQIDVPTAVVVTEQDRAIAPERQRDLAARIPGATVHDVAAGHAACITDPDTFVPVALEAARSAAARAGDRARAQHAE